MNRKLLVAMTATVLTVGLGGSALASGTDSQGNEYGFCVGLSQTHNGPIDGVCVWLPTDKVAK